VELRMRGWMKAKRWRGWGVYRGAGGLGELLGFGNGLRLLILLVVIELLNSVIARPLPLTDQRRWVVVEGHGEGVRSQVLQLIEKEIV
jgi:hypothetical protein